MTDFLAAAAIAFAAVLLVELPDKTLVATLVLSTRYRRGPVLVGVSAAFAVQSVIAVTAGGLLRLLPQRLLEAIVALLFGLGAFLLLRESGAPDEEAETAVDDPRDTTVSDVKVASLSFGVLFAAEWGDASQLVTAGLVAKYGQPLAIGLGAFAALVAVAAMATVVGAVILRRVPLHWVHRVAGTLFALFAVLAAATSIRG